MKIIEKNKSRFPQFRWWQWLIAAVLLLLIVLTATARWWNPVIFPSVKDAHIGVSFSVKQAQALGVDWQQNYTALLDDMNIKHFRLMSYWDLGEPSPGQFNFTDLDSQIAQAKKHGADVTLSIGYRQPRWPECHDPNWAQNLNVVQWRQALNEYLGTVVSRYENNSTVISWQLENEYSNNAFAKCRDTSRDRLQDEFSLVRSLSKKPIWMSLADQAGYPVNPPHADRYGFSVYRTVWSTGIYTGYFTFPTSIWYHRLRAAIISHTSGQPIFIHELQLEPWGPTDIPYLSKAEQDKSMSLQQIHDSMMFAREIGAKDIYTWGGEWWYWRKVNGDPSVWNTVKYEFEQAEKK